MFKVPVATQPTVGVVASAASSSNSRIAARTPGAAYGGPTMSAAGKGDGASKFSSNQLQQSSVLGGQPLQMSDNTGGNNYHSSFKINSSYTGDGVK